MNRPWQIWSAFVACLVVVVAAVGWVSVEALEADAAEVAAKRQAALEENARLALWRMDSFMAPLVAQESARPYFTYASFYSAERAYGKVLNRKGEPDIMCPSPLLTQTNPYVRLHFQCDSQNSLTSPEVPKGKFVGLAVPEYLSVDQCQSNEGMLTGLQKALDLPLLLADLPPPAAATTAPAMAPSNNNLTFNNGSNANGFQQSNNYNNTNSAGPNIANIAPNLNAPPSQMPQSDANGEANASQPSSQQLSQQGQQQALNFQPSAQSFDQQGARGQTEYQARQRSVAQSASVSQFKGMNENFDGNANPGQPSEVQMSMMTPLWLAGDLVLARRVHVGTREFVQGCLLDWPAIREQLLIDVNDLLPQADLVPDPHVDPSSSVRRLASLPVTLIPGSLPDIVAAGLSPIKLSLLVAWGAMGLAALAVAVLLQGVVALSERRAAFVSAVTHELRTPLTTFRMYAEMLSEGMIPQESDRRSYLQTLRVEADRLTHLVGNVLAYARLERGRPGGRIEIITVEQLLKVATQRLADRAGQADLQLSIEPTDGVMQRRVKADPAAVEQILFNLVDNACKYATSATDRTLHLSAAAENGRVWIRLRDHGAGVLPTEQRRLFQPFHKSAQEAALSAPGVGLGLALSQRLARDMHGDLRYERCNDGACFALSLPAA